MRIALRVDASLEMGIGHFMRCLTLADALAEQGASVRFVSRHLPGYLRERLAVRGHEFVALAAAAREPGPRLEYGHWLGTDPGADADETVRALDGRVWDWIVVDHYALDAVWEEAVRPVTRHVLVIDDLANRSHACDLLLDQNLVADGADRYGGRVGAGCRLLLGPRYALLRPEYRAVRDALAHGARSRDLSRVLVFFGGTDPGDMTGLALDALSRSALRHLTVDVVCGSDPSRRAALEAISLRRPGTHVHGPRPHLADLMAQADLAVGAGGSTTWERMCLGLRSVVVTLADNQEAVARCLAAEDLIRLLGRAGDVTADRIHDAVLDEIGRGPDPALSTRAMELSDGRGVSRVIEAMRVPATTTCCRQNSN